MKYQKYEKYKSSNNPWFDELPENWTVSRIKFNSVLFGRIGYRGYSTDDLVDENEGAITLSPSNMINGKLDFSKCTYLSWAKYHESPEIKMLDNDVVMVKTGSTLGKVAFADKIKYATTINPQLVLYKKIKCNPKFLFYYLASKNVQDRIPLYNTGSTIPTMKQEDIGSFYIPIPSWHEQESIVKLLDIETNRIDALILKKQKLIELLKEKRKSQIAKAVTKGLNPNVDMKESGIEWLGEVPIHWVVKRLKYFAKINNGKDQKEVEDDNGKYPILGTGGVFGYTDSYLYKKPSVLLGRKGTIDNPLYIDKPFWTVDTLFYTAIKNNVYPKYFYYACKNIPFNLFKYGSAVPSMTQEDLSNIFLAYPNYDEQVSISNYLDNETLKIDNTISLIENAIIKQIEYRISLISSAVTGKIKITKGKV